MTEVVRDDGGDGVLISIKAVPGAKRDEVSGMLGDRVKIRVSAPPEGGKANSAICRVVAEKLGVRDRQVEIVSGHTNPEKVVRVTGMTLGEVVERFGI